MKYCVCVKSPQPCPTLCDPMDCSLPSFPVHGIFQARILGWVALSSSRGNGILFRHKEGNLDYCNNMNGLWRHYAKYNKSDRERQILYNFTYMCNLKKEQLKMKQMSNKQSSCTQIRGYQKQGVTEWVKWEKRVKKYKLSAIKWINHGNIMYSIGTIVNNVVYRWTLLGE